MREGGTSEEEIKDLYGAEGVNWEPDQTIARDVEIYVESCNQLIKQ